MGHRHFSLLLMVIRGIVLLTEKRNRARLETEQNHCRRRTFLISLVRILAPDLPISMIVVLDKLPSMGEIPAIAIAAYTTWKVTMVSIHMGRQRRRPSGNFLVAELRTVNLIDALLAILTLHNTLIMVKRSAADENAMLPLSASSSGGLRRDRVHHRADAAKRPAVNRRPYLLEANIKSPMLCCSLAKHSMGDLLPGAAHQVWARACINAYSTQWMTASRRKGAQPGTRLS